MRNLTFVLRCATRAFGGEKTMYQEKETQHREEALKRYCQTCPQCGQAWLVFGLRENEAYTCQTCRHRFTILHSYCSDTAAPHEQKRDQLRSNQTNMQGTLSANLCEAQDTSRSG
jgi:hypothetical protein